MLPAFFDSVVELITRTSTDLPPDVRAAMGLALSIEAPSSRAGQALTVIAQNIDRIDMSGRTARRRTFRNQATSSIGSRHGAGRRDTTQSLANIMLPPGLARSPELLASPLGLKLVRRLHLAECRMSILASGLHQ